MGRVVQFAIRETPKGYQLTEVSTEDTNFGGRCRFSRPTNLYYKRREFAIQKAKSFYQRLYGRYFVGVTTEFVGVIGPNEYNGEQVQV